MQEQNTNVIPAIQAVDICHALPMASGMVHILKDVSFRIATGEWVTLMGPSGSGKSTLLGIIAGLESPVEGHMLIDGIDIAHARESKLAHFRNTRVGVVFQSFNLIPTLTAQENVEIPLFVNSRHGNISRRAQEMLDLVGLADRRNHRPSQLSGGQQQRVAIARALVTQPSILVADEPTGNLDSKTGRQILDLFETLHRDLGLTLIIATHDPLVAERANRTLHLVDGRLTIFPLSSSAPTSAGSSQSFIVIETATSKAPGELR